MRNVFNLRKIFDANFVRWKYLSCAPILHFLSHLYNDDWDWKQLNEFKNRPFYLPFVFAQDRLILKLLNQIKLTKSQKYAASRWKTGGYNKIQATRELMRVIKRLDMWDALHDLLPFVQFKKRKKHPGFSLQLYQK